MAAEAEGARLEVSSPGESSRSREEGRVKGGGGGEETGSGERSNSRESSKLRDRGERLHSFNFIMSGTAAGEPARSVRRRLGGGSSGSGGSGRYGRSSRGRESKPLWTVRDLDSARGERGEGGEGVGAGCDNQCAGAYGECEKFPKLWLDQDSNQGPSGAAEMRRRRAAAEAERCVNHQWHAGEAVGEVGRTARDASRTGEAD